MHAALQDLERAKQMMAQLPPPMKMADVERNAERGGRNPQDGSGNGNTEQVSVGRIGQPVPLPSSSFRTVKGGRVLQLSVPSNWQEVTSTTSLKFVPENGYGPPDTHFLRRDHRGWIWRGSTDGASQMTDRRPSVRCGCSP